VDALGDAVEIAGLGVPVLAFAFVHGELDGVAVGAVEGGVFVEDGLDPIVAGGESAEIGGGIAESVVGNDGVLARGESVDVNAEDLLGFYFEFEDLVAGLGVVGGGDDHVDAAVKRSGAELRIERDGEARLGIACSADLLLSSEESVGRGRECNESCELVERKSTRGAERAAAEILGRTRHQNFPRRNVDGVTRAAPL